MQMVDFWNLQVSRSGSVRGGNTPTHTHTHTPTHTHHTHTHTHTHTQMTQFHNSFAHALMNIPKPKKLC